MTTTDDLVLDPAQAPARQDREWAARAPRSCCILGFASSRGTGSDVPHRLAHLHPGFVMSFSTFVVSSFHPTCLSCQQRRFFVESFSCICPVTCISGSDCNNPKNPKHQKSQPTKFFLKYPIVGEWHVGKHPIVTQVAPMLVGAFAFNLQEFDLPLIDFM